jgi:hypothetical protein
VSPVRQFRDAAVRASSALRYWSLSLCLVIGSAGAQNSTPSEFRSKAHFLTNFGSFVEWPDGTFASPQAPLKICVSGDFRFGTVLAEVARGVTPHGRALEVRWARKDDELRACQIVFVSRSDSKRYSQVLDTISQQGVLTVGESLDFLAAGGIITFDFDHEILQFEVNLQAAQNARLKISSRLLALARRVVGASGDKS